MCFVNLDVEQLIHILVEYIYNTSNGTVVIFFKNYQIFFLNKQI